MRQTPLKRTQLKAKAYKYAALDNLFSLIVRHEGVCEFQGARVECSGRLECMHYKGRDARTTRWELINAFAGCRAHHVWYTAHPEAFTDDIREKYGESRLEEIQAIYNQTKGPNPQEKMKELKKLKAAL